MTGAKLSVGPPYFNALFVPLMGLLMAMIAVGVVVRWKDTPLKWLLNMLAPVLIGSVVWPWWPTCWSVTSTGPCSRVCLLAAWVVLAGVRDISRQDPPQGSAQRPAEPDPQLLGHADAHSGYGDLRLGRGADQHGQLRARHAHGTGRVEWRSAVISLSSKAPSTFEGPNFTSDKGTVRILEDGKQIACCTRRNACIPCSSQ